MKSKDSVLEILRGGFVSASPEDTVGMAEKLSSEISAGSFLALYGDLGTGKTTFVKGLARGLGVRGTVKSPSFGVYSIYDAEAGVKLVHVDAYRLRGSEDFDNLLIDEIVSEPKIVCAEWANIIAESIPEDSLCLYFSTDGNLHRIELRDS